MQCYAARRAVGGRPGAPDSSRAATELEEKCPVFPKAGWLAF